MKNRLRHLFRPNSIKLKTKILWVYGIIIIISLGLFSFYASHEINSVIEERTFSAASTEFSDIEQSLSERCAQLNSIIDIITSNPLIYDVALLKKDIPPYLQRLEDVNAVIQYFYYLKTLSGIDKITLYVDNDYTYVDNNSIISLSDVKDKHWFKSIRLDETEYWFLPEELAIDGEADVYSLMRIIFDPSNIKEPSAIIRADIKKEKFESLLSSDYLVVRADGSSATSSWSEVEIDGEKHYFRSSLLSPSDLMLVSRLPFSAFYSESWKMQVQLIIVVIFLAFLAYFVAYKIMHSTILRLSHLTESMQAVESGDLSVVIEPDGDEEIGMLMLSFQHMLQRINALIEEKIEQGKEIKSLELKALQAQINPHFLYNTLDVINCMAIQHDVPEISSTVNALARFYRISLSKGNEIISIKDEITHAKLYLQIQKIRFGDRLNVIYEIDETVYEYSVIKIILQPIIENAIIHGIFEKESKSGTVVLKAYHDETFIYFEVRDDGVGMDDDTRNKNFSSNKGGEGYGLSNIKERLKLSYSDKADLECSSKKGNGTIVRVRIPKIKGDS